MASPGEAGEVSVGLTDYLAILRKHWLIGFITCLSVVVTALVYESGRPQVYAAFVDVLIAPEPLTGQVLRPSLAARQNTQDLSYYTDHVRSEACIGDVIEHGAMGDAPPRYSPAWMAYFEKIFAATSASRLQNRRVVRVEVLSADPDFAVRLANAFGPAYVRSLTEVMQMSVTRMDDFLSSEIQQTELELARYRAIRDALERRQKALETPDTVTSTRERVMTSLSILRERTVVIQRARADLNAGRPLSLEQMEAALDDVFETPFWNFDFTVVPGLRENLDAGRREWGDAQKRYRAQLAGLRPRHPDYRKSHDAAARLATEWVERLTDWVSDADANMAAQIERLSTLATPSEQARLDEIYLTQAGRSASGGDTVASEPIADGGPMTMERCETEISLRESMLAELVKKKSDISLQKSGQSIAAQWIRPATRPTAPRTPNMRQAAILGGAMGLMMAGLMIFLVASLDRSLRISTPSEGILGKTVLAVIPRFKDGPPQPEGPLFHRLIVRTAPQSPAAEAYRLLAYNVSVNEHKFLVITSTGPQEGKSTTSANLAVALAELGKSVLLVSANLRRPTLHLFFGHPDFPGIRECIIENRNWRDLVLHTPIEGVNFLPSGNPDLGNVVALLSAPLLFDSLREASDEYDYVIVDVPPTAPVSDVLHFARQADGIILVYMLGRATSAAVAGVIKSLEYVGGRILGIVLNDIKGNGNTYAYGYKYGVEYASGDEEARPGQERPGPERLEQAGLGTDGSSELS